MTIENLSKSFRNHNVLEDINLQLENGHIYGLLGRNGVGKTTFLKILGNEITKYKGEIYIYNEKLKENSLALDNIALINENIYFDNMKVSEIVNGAKILYKNWDDELFTFLLDEFGIVVKGNYHKLSKGNKMMINIIIGLSSGAKILLLDEPFANLDPIYKYKLIEILREKFIDNNRLLVISSNSIHELSSLIDNLIVLKNKNIFLNSPIEEIIEKSNKLIGNSEEINKIIGKKMIIFEDKIGGKDVYYIYDRLTIEERKLLEDADIEISTYNYEELFMYYVGGAK